MSIDQLDDYTKADFPLVVNWSGGGCKVRLLAACGGRVIGYSFREWTRDGETHEEHSQSLDWDGQGIYAEGQYSTMNLPPPPAMTATRIAALEDEMASAQGRLDGMPDAPREWRSVDERRITQIMRETAELKGEAA